MPDPQPWEQQFQAAREAVYKLAASGGRSFRMTIPPQPDDTDTLLCGVLDASQAEIARLHQEIAGLEFTNGSMSRAVDLACSGAIAASNEADALRALLAEVTAERDKAMQAYDDLAERDSHAVDAVYQQLKAENTSLRSNLTRLREALAEVVETFGPWHGEDCPGDDTCDCSAKPLHDRINAALAPSSPASPDRVCPHCHLPAVVPEVCTPEIHDAIQASIERDWQTFEAGRQHGLKHPLNAADADSPAPSTPQEQPE